MHQKIMLPIPDEKLIFELIQDMQVRLRDINDFSESMQYKKVIKKFQEGFKREYAQS